MCLRVGRHFVLAIGNLSKSIDTVLEHFKRGSYALSKSLCCVLSACLQYVVKQEHTREAWSIL